MVVRSSRLHVKLLVSPAFHLMIARSRGARHMTKRLDGLLLSVKRVQDSARLRVWIRIVLGTLSKLLLHKTRVFLQYIVLDEHVSFELVLIILV